MAYEHDVQLLLGATGTACNVFSSYRAVLDMTQVGNGFTFELWRSDYERSAWDVLVGGRDTRTRVRCGDWVGLTIDSTLVLLGQVDAARAVGERGGTKLVISGRDILAPAVDSHADPRTVLPDATHLSDALERLLSPLGIALFVGVDPAASRAAATGRRLGSRGITATRRRHRQRVGAAHPKPGETAWGLCETLLRKVGLMAWVAPLEERRMALVVGTPEYSQPPTYSFSLREVDGVAEPGDNVLRWSHEVNTHGVPYEVFVRTGSDAAGSGADGRSLVQRANGALLSDDVTGGWVGEQLPEVRRWLSAPRARTHGAAAQSADRALADANRKLRTLELEVQGHGQFTSAGFRLYAIDTTARVRLDAIGLDEVMYVDRVEFSGGRDHGATTTLRLHPLGAINLVPDPEA